MLRLESGMIGQCRSGKVFNYELWFPCDRISLILIAGSIWQDDKMTILVGFLGN